MNAYLNYIIEANIALILFLIAYVVVLENETDFKSKRVFMLIGILSSLAFPLLHIQFAGATIPTVSQVMPSYILPRISVSGEGQMQTVYSSTKFEDGWFYLQLIYLTGLAFFFLRFLFQVVNLMQTIKNAQCLRVGKLQIIEIDEDKAFSFFNYIFIGKSRGLSAEDHQKIILHEAAHAKQLHSFDILLLSILSIIFWFNPFLRNYKKIFVQLHEFEADARAAENNNVNEYCSLLAKVALTSADFSLANHFNNSLTLKRIEMMKRIKQNIRPWKMLLIASLIPLAFFIMACHDQAMDMVYTVVDETAVPVGGMGSFYEHVGRKIKYPAEARKIGMEGKVFVEFIVDTDSSIADVKTVKSIGELCDLEVRSSVQSGPKWIPGKINGLAVKQRITLPVYFKLGAGSGKKDQAKSPEGSIEEVVVVAFKD